MGNGSVGNGRLWPSFLTGPAVITTFSQLIIIYLKLVKYFKVVLILQGSHTIRGRSQRIVWLLRRINKLCKLQIRNFIVCCHFIPQIWAFSSMISFALTSAILLLTPLFSTIKLLEWSKIPWGYSREFFVFETGQWTCFTKPLNTCLCPWSKNRKMKLTLFTDF